MKRSLLLFALVLCATAVSAHAQNGCVNSPENPTALLAVVGGAAGVLRWFRSRP